MRISIEQTGRITVFVLAITLITGCLVTGLLLAMWMRGRKTGIAVYEPWDRKSQFIAASCSGRADTVHHFILCLGASYRQSAANGRQQFGDTGKHWRKLEGGLCRQPVCFRVRHVHDRITDGDRHFPVSEKEPERNLIGNGGIRMNLFGLSIRSVLRKRAKTVLLLLIIFITSAFIFAGWACKSASIQTQNESKQAIGASFRLEENEANRHERMEELSKQVGDGNGGEGGYYQEQLASGDWRTWTDNSFETLLMEDILRIAEVDGSKHNNRQYSRQSSEL